MSNKNQTVNNPIPRKIVQVTAMAVTVSNPNGSFLVLCDDGTLWHVAGSIGPGLVWYQIDTSPIKSV
jgi:hypothetical protein